MKVLSNRTETLGSRIYCAPSWARTITLTVNLTFLFMLSLIVLIIIMVALNIAQQTSIAVGTTALSGPELVVPTAVKK